MGGKSGSSTIGYWYKLKLLFGLCQGPVDVFLQWDVDGATAWMGEVTSNSTIYINAEELFGGEDEQGGILGYADIMLGGEDQAVNSWLTANLGSEHSAYRDLLTVAFKGGKWSAFTPYPKSPSFVVRRIYEGWLDDTCWYPERALVPIRVGEVFISDLAFPATSAGTASGYAGVVLQGGFTASDVLIIDKPAGLTYQGWSRWSSDTDSRAAGLPWSNDFVVTDADGNDVRYWFGEVEDDGDVTERYATAAEAEAAYSGRYIALTGSAKYTLWLDDTPPADNRGGLSVRVYKGGLLAMNPAHIIYDSITHPTMGDEPVALINDASFRAAAETFYNENLGLCMEYDADSESIEEFQQRALDAAGAVLSQDPTDGQYRLDVPRGQYVLEDLPVLTDDDILEWSEEPTTLDDACNQLYVKYYDPIEDADGTTPPLQALGAIQAFGGVVSEKEDRSGEVADVTLGLKIGARNLRAKATPLRKFDLKTTPVVRSWRPGTYFQLQAPKRGIASMVCLMGEKKGGTLKSGAVSFSASEDVYSQPDTVYVGTTSGASRPNTSPTVSAYQVALEVPYALLAGSLSAADLAALTSDAGYLLALSARPTVGQYFRLMIQLGDADYAYKAQGDWCPSAALVEAADYLTTAFTLADVSDLDEVAVGELVLLGAELCRVDAIDADGLTLTLARGCLDTVPHQHAAGARVYFAAGYAWDSTEYIGGETINAKLLTRGVSAITDLDDAAVLAVEMNDRQARPYPPAGLSINDEAYPDEVFGAVALTWAHRDRVSQADQIVDTTVASIGPESGVTYTARWYVNDVLQQETSGIDGTTATYTPAGDGVLKVEVLAVRDGLESWQTAVHSCAYRISPYMPYADEQGNTYADESGNNYLG